jgi:YD repeat-containing protein
LSVTYPDGRQRLYSYNEPGLTGGADLPNALTGITDENGARFATYAYDQYGRTIETVHDAGGSNANRYRLQYDISGAQTTVIDPAGTTRTYGFDTVLGVVQNTGVTQSSASGSGLAANSTVYDPGGNVASRTDFNGNRTNYEYDLTRNLETRRVEGLTAAGGATPQTRTISTAWHPAWRLPTRIAEPLKITSFAYNGDGGTACGLMADGTTPVPGVLCAKTIQATTDADGSRGFAATAAGSPRTWRYVYNANGLVLAADGPRDDVADVTSTTYFADDDPDFGKRGNVATITNAAGHVTSITAYNAHGQPTTIVDPNGLVTTLTYDARQRLAMRTVGTETTSYAYDGVGQLIRVTLPDGSFLAYAYDAAHRLTGMADSLGNSVSYTLDAMGNRVREDVFDPSSVLAQTRRRVYDNLNRLFREVGAVGQTTEYSYDNEGNVISVKDPLNRVTGNRYDALNRLAQVTDPNQGVTRYGYNGLDALTSVTDPRGLVTGYVVDGLGNLNEQSSPDTGTTTNTYDAAGNLVRQTDAKGQTAAYAYDALNRVTSITFADGSKHVFVYDQGTNGLGRLTGITETDPASQVTSQIGYGYDAHGRVVSESRTLAGQTHSVAYGYDAAGRLAGMTYPSGRSVTYAYDGAGRIAEVATTYDAQSQIVAQQVQYHPFGGVKSYVLGNGQPVSRTIDLDGRVAGYTLGNESYAISFDQASRITGISRLGNPASANSYGYDDLDRLISAVLPNATHGYSYDPVGNRLTKSTAAGTDIYTYSPASNRIASLAPAAGPVRSFTFDANGSTTADGVNSYAYDTRGRMSGASSSSGLTFYQVNALGQRVRKTNFQGDTVFHYDIRGRLIAETDAQGNLKRELLYLGDIPVAVFQ